MSWRKLFCWHKWEVKEMEANTRYYSGTPVAVWRSKCSKCGHAKQAIKEFVLREDRDEFLKKLREKRKPR